MRNLWGVGTVLLFLIVSISPAYAANTYYVAPDKLPDGTDNTSDKNDTAPTFDSNGTVVGGGGTIANPFATFNFAWNYLYPGDTLVLKDGIYHQRIHPNIRDGLPTNPIIIKAEHDGDAVIDGDTDGDPNTIEDRLQRPLQLGESWPGPIGNYYVVEGLVVKNGGRDCYDTSQSCYHVGATVGIHGHHNVLRRISAYNAHTDLNSVNIGVYGHHNVVEDCVAVGSGRKMAYVSPTSNGYNTFRRCFTAQLEWRGKDFNPGHWPWGENLETYNASNNIIESSISYGRALAGINIFAQSGTDAIGNAVLGSIAIKTGMNWDGSNINWPCPYPYGGSYPDRTCADFNSWAQRNGFRLGAPNGGLIQNNLFQDIFAYGSGNLGLHTAIPSGSNGTNQLIRATLVNNGLGQPINSIYQNKNMIDFSAFSSIQDSFIEGTTYQGNGADLTTSYESYFDANDNLVVNKTTKPLWPWPMEDRIKAEFTTHLAMYHNQTPELINFSVTNTIYPLLAQYGAVDGSSPTPISVIGDTNNDQQVDSIDINNIITNFNSPTFTQGDFNQSGMVNILDLSILLTNFGN